MPKVLRLINRLNLGGPTYNTAYLSKYLAPEFETLLVAGMKEESEESSEFIVRQMGLHPVYIPEMHREINLIEDRKAYKKIRELIGDFRPDIVHTHAAKAGALGRLAASSMKVPVIIHTYHGHVFHSYFSPAKTYIFKKIERYLSSISTRIIAISNIQKEELCNHYKVCSLEQTVVIPLGFDLERFHTGQQLMRDRFRREFLIEEDTVVVAIIGRLVPIKNHPMFIRVMKQVIENSKVKVKGVIVGDGEDRLALEQLAAGIGLKVSTRQNPVADADIIFTGWILDVERALSGCDIVAMTSRNEGTPVSLIEAQAAAKPVVATDVGGIRDIILPGITGLISAPSDEEGFAKNLSKILDNKSIRDSMVIQSRSFTREKFHYTRLVEDMRQLYRSLLN